MSPCQTLEPSFSDIMKAAKKEDYEQCAVNALKFINKCKEENPDSYLLPYANYFKLFSEAYRTWQISYDYTPIRNRFILAYQVLRTEPNVIHGAKINKDDSSLFEVFEYLSKMLCAYTKCENSIINNDPFALKVYAEEARKLELKGLDLLRAGKLETSADGYRREIARWLGEYLLKNFYLHDGFKDCADYYVKLLKRKHPLTSEEEEAFNKIKQNNLEPLQSLSSELWSELNAHIRHIEQHNERLKRLKKNPEKNTYLRINKGSLVIMMSAAFDKDSAKELFTPVLEKKFDENVADGFKSLGVEISAYQLKQLNDIFQTSFGEKFLKVMSFDLYKSGNIENRTEIGVEILNELYNFDLRFSLSALGVFTLSFTLDIDALEDKEDSEEKNNLRYENGKRVRGLRVEEARVLQSLLCPHAGQVKIEDALSNNSKLKDLRLIEQLEFSDLLNDLDALRCWLKENLEAVTIENSSLYDTLKETVDLVDDSLREVKTEWLSQIKSNDDKNESVNIKKLMDALSRLVDLKLPENGFSKCREVVKEISRKCDTYQYLTHLAEQYLKVIESALNKTLEKDIKFKLAADTGWFTYLYCHSIDEVSMNGGKTIEKKLPGFNEIADHPDMRGFVLEQREARTSFDDWRFIKRFDPYTRKLASIDLQENNLALLRSHQTDGFFCTEYQAFIYFPDDPMYLTDQYKDTIRLMVRLATVLKYISVESRSLAERIQKELLHEDSENQSPKELDNALDNILQLRLYAKELQILVARAAISRYKDHGDLMKRVLSEMKLDQMADLLDQQLQHLAELYADVLRKVDEKRESRANIAIELLTAVVTFSALNALTDLIFDIFSLKNFFESIGFNDEKMAKGWFTLICIGFAFLLLIFLIAYRKRRGNSILGILRRKQRK